jgi:hypothetical protein
MRRTTRLSGAGLMKCSRRTDSRTGDLEPGDAAAPRAAYRDDLGTLHDASLDTRARA